ncbi:MAG: hypothetical protein B7733_06190 [Myxococcales bacterium FL481]|nr:MAG: hypothetical protein B7733_06190 [Myxococcales bacterium FL481]
MPTVVYDFGPAFTTAENGVGNDGAFTAEFNPVEFVQVLSGPKARAGGGFVIKAAQAQGGGRSLL